MKRKIGYAFGAAALFGASTPFSKLLLGQLPPSMLAGLLYLGSGVGLCIGMGRFPSLKALSTAQKLWFSLAILLGGGIGPILLLQGLGQASAASSSLLLNLESVLTALLAWFVFRENFDRRLLTGMLAVVAGGVCLSWHAGSFTFSVGSLLIAGACLCWALDNNLMQKVSAGEPSDLAACKGLAAGSANLCLAWATGQWTSIDGPTIVGALMLGYLGYGLSLVFFVRALRELGTARTGAYFSLAPFVGAFLSLVIFHEVPTSRFWVALALMAWGVWLHVSERHQHTHTHEELEHHHEHLHDEHHQHEHGSKDPTCEPHTHVHKHLSLSHCHPHYPDVHHRHTH